jgi:cobalt-zinc-cadmium efflux system outer membrane protein
VNTIRVASRGTAVALVATALWVIPGGASPEASLKLDLRGAIDMAHKNHASVEAARRRIGEARGDLTGARVLLPENPELEIGVGPRFRPSPETGRSLDMDASLSQRLEIAGQRSHRIARARAEVATGESDAEVALRGLDVAVATAFFQALATRERVEIAGEHQRLAQDLSDIAQRRFDAGAGTPLDVNGARIRLAEASRALARTRAGQEVAAARLLPLLGAPEGAHVDLDGALPSFPPALRVDADIAVRNRPEIAAARRRVEGAEAVARLADAQAVPDIRIGARYALEEGSRVLLGTIAVPLPFFQRNQGERERSRAAVGRLEAEERSIRDDVLADVSQASVELERARHALRLYDESVLRAQQDNLVLLRRMFEAGKVSPAEVILLQRELLDGRLGYVDAKAELAVADARLRTALGLHILGEADGGSR